MSSNSVVLERKLPPKRPTPTRPSSTNNTFWNSRTIWYALVIFRCVNALRICTFFQPDEYFQSLEPAWQIAFGQESGAWITWEWNYQLRSSLHPALFAAVYFVSDKLVRLVQLSPHYRGLVLANVPNLAQAFIAATGDFYTWKLAEKTHGRSSSAARVALIMTIISPWQWFCSTRTFSNSLETTLTIAALNYWSQAAWTTLSFRENPSSALPPKAAKVLGLPSSSPSVNDPRISLLLAVTACILRPTNVLIWLGIASPIVLDIFNARKRLQASTYIILVREAVFCGLSILIVSMISDRLYFKQWTFPPYQWLNFNISQDLAVFYGKNDWHYYLSQGLPLLLTTYLPFTLVGLWKSTSLQADPASFTASSTILLTIGALSTIAHKEVRFIYPLLPLLHIIGAPLVTKFFLDTDQENANRSHSARAYYSLGGLKRKPFLLLLLILNIVVAGYTSIVHQRGVLDVVDFLRTDFETVAFDRRSPPLDAPYSINETFVGFLMPCHSTPWRSKLVHADLKAWALTCEPPIHLAARTDERKAYRDEADRFYDDPKRFLRTEVGTISRPWPRYVAGFAGLEDLLREHVKSVMKGVDVREKWRGKNSDWHDDWRRVGDVIVWELVTTKVVV